MAWLDPFFTEAELAPVEIATHLHYQCLLNDTKLKDILAAVKGRIVRYEFEDPEIEKVEVEKLPLIIVVPALVSRDAEPAAWSDKVRVRDILRVEMKGRRVVPRMPTYPLPGILSLVNYIVGVGLAERNRKLTWTPTGKTQERGLSTRVDSALVSVGPTLMNETGQVIQDYYLDFDYIVKLNQNGWQAEAALSNP